MAGLGAMAVSTAGSASASGSLPALSNGFCHTQTINLGYPTIEGKTCTGNYTVDRSNYQFTQDATHTCPRIGINANMTEKFISPPTGGAPTILAGYTVTLG